MNKFFFPHFFYRFALGYLSGKLLRNLEWLGFHVLANFHFVNFSKSVLKAMVMNSSFKIFSTFS